MAFEDVIENSSTKFVNFKLLEAGTVFAEGHLDAIVPNENSPFPGSENCFIKGEDGKSVGFGLTGSLRSLLKFGNVTEGCYVRMTYLGKEKLKKGQYKGSMAHAFKVEEDKSKRLTPLDAPVEAAGAEIDYSAIPSA